VTRWILSLWQPLEKLTNLTQVNDKFDPSKEEWSQYVERLTHFFQANCDVTDFMHTQSYHACIVNCIAHAIVRMCITYFCIDLLPSYEHALLPSSLILHGVRS